MRGWRARTSQPECARPLTFSTDTAPTSLPCVPALQITTRLRNAREEMASMDEPGLYDYVLTNNSLEECYQQLKAVAERALGGDVGGPEAATAAAAAVAAKGAGEQQQQAAAASMEQRQQQQQQPGSPEAALGAAATFKGWLSERAPAGLERWRGSVALVTGAGGGVGAALAASLAAAGLRVVAVSRRKHALEALQVGLGCHHASCDDICTLVRRTCFNAL